MMTFVAKIVFSQPLSPLMREGQPYFLVAPLKILNTTFALFDVDAFNATT